MDESVIVEYGSYVRKKTIFIILSFISVILAGTYSMTLGASDVGFYDVWRILKETFAGVEHELYSKPWQDQDTVFNIRFPRVIFGIICGGGLAVGGVAMQSVMRNPLADPYTTGVSSAAMFGGAIALIMGISVTSSLGEQYGVVMNALLFSMIPVVLMIMLAPYTNKSPATLILAGIAISFFFSALRTLLMVSTDIETMAMVYHWQIGSLDNLHWSDVPAPLTITIIGSMSLLFLSNKLNIISTSDEDAKSLGVNPETLRIVCLILLSAITASVVVFVGIIGFVGLVTPHIVRLVIGSDNRFVLPGSFFFGASFLLFCDIVSRHISDIGGMPVGVIVSFLGGIVFITVLFKQRSNIW